MANTVLCIEGSSAGECRDPEEVAANWDTGRVYIADRFNNRVNVFDASGSFVLSFGWGVRDGTTPTIQACGPGASPPSSACFPGLAGAGPGQFSGPQNISVDNSGGPAQGAVYVGTDNRRVQRFTPDGNLVLMFGGMVNKTKVKQRQDQEANGQPVTVTPAEENLCTVASGDECGAGVLGSGEGYFQRIGNSPLDVSLTGDVYVADNVAGGGVSARLQRFNQSGEFEQTVFLGSTEFPSGLTMDGTGGGYVIFLSRVSRFNADGTIAYEVGTEFPVNSVALHPMGNVYMLQFVQRPSGPAIRTISVYDETGSLVRRSAYMAHGMRLALRPTLNDFVVGDFPRSRADLVSERPPGPVIAAPLLRAADVTMSRGLLVTEVNPNGKTTDVRFEYVDIESFEADGWDSPNVGATPTESLGDMGFELVEADASIGCPDPVTEAGLPDSECLAPETVYRFRVIATNADNPVNGDRVEGEFTTLSALDLEASWAVGVGVESARLGVQINPLGIPATGYFEYVTEGEFQESGFSDARTVPDLGAGQGELDFGTGEGSVVREVSLSGLSAAMTYRYRAVASNALLAEPIHGPAQMLRTFGVPAVPTTHCPGNAEFRMGTAAFLPDCRAYELVSPVDKNNGDIVARPQESTLLPATLEQSSVSGERMAYGSYRAFGDALSAPYTSHYLATRDGVQGEWRSHGISPPREKLVLPSSRLANTEFKAFSSDLCMAWVRTVAEPRLDPSAVPGYANIYKRENCPDRWEARTTVPPTVGSTNYYRLEFQGASADGAQAIYVANDKLTSNAPSLAEDKLRLYESLAGGDTRYVCILPNGSASANPCSAGMGSSNAGDSLTANVKNAISADGSRIFWTETGSAGNGTGPGRIYVRDTGGTATATDDRTIAVSQAAEAQASTTSSAYRAAAADGSEVFFTTGGSLYRFLVDEEATIEVAEGVSGFLGSNENGSHVYFVSTHDLVEGAKLGSPNLYLYRPDEGIVFIAALSSADANPSPLKGRRSPVALNPFERTSRVTSDGRHVLFMSTARLTGVDNVDAGGNGQPNAQLFLYDADSAELICVSCNPSGARPVGANIGNADNQFWAAGWIRGWQNTLYSDRALAEDGTRVFFESSDVLSPRDTNGKVDVYQWEKGGSGDCTESGSFYSPLNAGCVSLISTGQSDRDSEFRDASASGDDVFFATISSLVPQDSGLVDIYDARVGGGLPGPLPHQPECEGDICQHSPPPPSPISPASSTFRGLETRPDPPSCGHLGRKARQRAARAKRAMRAARATGDPRRARALRVQARRATAQSKRFEASAQRCRRARGGAGK